jgi:hypothetical protein
MAFKVQHTVMETKRPSGAQHSTRRNGRNWSDRHDGKFKRCWWLSAIMVVGKDKPLLLIAVYIAEPGKRASSTQLFASSLHKDQVGRPCHISLPSACSIFSSISEPFPSWKTSVSRHILMQRVAVAWGPGFKCAQNLQSPDYHS